jgi:hypothetical protein
MTKAGCCFYAPNFGGGGAKKFPVPSFGMISAQNNSRPLNFRHLNFHISSGSPLHPASSHLLPSSSSSSFFIFRPRFRGDHGQHRCVFRPQGERSRKRRSGRSRSLEQEESSSIRDRTPRSRKRHNKEVAAYDDANPRD